MSINDFTALQKYSNIPRESREKILSNVFCSNCFVTTIVDFTITNDDDGIVIKGKCKKCGRDVARLIENE